MMFIENIYVSSRRTTSEFESNYPHIHENEHQLIYAKNDIGSIIINDNNFNYKSGCIYYVPKGILHECNNKIGTDYDFFLFTVSSSIFEDGLKSITYGIIPHNPTFIKYLIKQILYHKNSKNPMAECFQYGYFSMLLTAIMDKTFNMPFLPCDSSLINDKCLNSKNGTFDKLLEFINTCVTTNVDIERMCKFSGYQRTQLFRIFKNKLGITPHQYVNELRIEYAKALLDDTDSNITDISLMVGFNSADVFTRVFRKTEGYSPTEYRIRNKL